MQLGPAGPENLVSMPFYKKKIKLLPQSNRLAINFFQMTTDFRCVNFTLLRDFPVARLSPYVSVELFDWYSPGERDPP